MLTQVLLNSLGAAAAYALVGVGFGLIYSTSRFFHFAHAAVYSAGAYAAYTVAVSCGLGWWLGLPCGVVFAGVVGACLQITVFHRLRRAAATPTILFLASLGLLIAIQNLISLAYGDGALVLRREVANSVYQVAGATFTRAQAERILVAIIVLTLLWSSLRLTKWGRQVRATANDTDLARAVGVHTDRVLLGIFAVGSALAGLAAIMLAHDSDLRPFMGFHILLPAVVAVVIGGVGSIPGAALGSLLVAFLQNAAVWVLPAQWGDAVAYALMIIFLLARPRGFLGSARALGAA